MKNKKVTAEQIEAAAWAAALHTQVTAEDVPHGWHTTVEIAKKLNKSASTTGRLLLTAMRAGKCERKIYRVNCGSSVRPVPHYKLSK